jgi:hypothetical protein
VTALGSVGVLNAQSPLTTQERPRGRSERMNAGGSDPSTMLRLLRRVATVVKIATLAMLALTLGATPARPQPSALAERDFRIEWALRRNARGSAIAGYVYNAGGMAATKVSVLIEGLDASGRPVNSTVGHVFGTVPTFNRAYFEERVPEATSYRVSLLSFEWLWGGGGGR